MPDEAAPLFSFDEPNHLVRIHLNLALEAIGFRVVENGIALSITGAEPSLVPLGTIRKDRR